MKNTALKTISVFIIFSGLIASIRAEATSQNLTYQGRVLKANGKPLEDASVTFTMKVFSPRATGCLLYSETQTLDMTGSKGQFSLALGSGTDGQYYGSIGGSPVTAMNQIFINNPNSIIGGLSCAVGSSYTSGYVDDRELVVSVNDGVVSFTLDPIVIRSVPFALQAGQISGWGINNLVKVSTVGDATTFSLTEMTNVKAMGAAVCGVNEVLKWSGTTWVCGTVAPALTAAGYNVAGVVSIDSSALVSGLSITSGVLKLAASGVSAGTYGSATQVPSVTVDSFGRVTNVSLVPITSGIQNLNGLTASSQSFAIGSTGNAPAFSSNTSTHTLNIPMASTASVTAGLISNADYTNFNSKLSSSSAFTGDVSGTASATSVDKIKGVAVSATAPTDGQFLKYSGGSWVGSTISIASDIAGVLAIGNGGTNSGTALNNNRLMVSSAGAIVEAGAMTDGQIVVGKTGLAPQIVTLSGDASVSNLGTLSLKNTGTAGTYAKVVTDAQGRITSGTSLAASDVTTGLGYTPVNKAGDSMSGNLNLAANTNVMLGNYATDPAGLGVADKGRTWFNTSSGQLKYWDGTTAQAVGGSTGGGISQLNGLSISSQSLAIGTTGTAPAFVSAASTHTLNIPMASAASVTAGLLSNADYATFNAKLSSASSFSGDISGTASTTSVDKIKGVAVSATAPTAGQFLKYSGGNWVGSNISVATDVGGILPVGNGGTGTATGSITGAVGNDLTFQPGSTNKNLVLNPGSTSSYVLLAPTGGSIGVGTATPNSAMQINGTVTGKAAVLNASSTIDYSTGNWQYTAASCGNFNLNNMKDGGTYVFAVQGTSATTCAFSAYTGVGSGALTVKYPPDHGTVPAGREALYTFMVIGSKVYVSWVLY